ncbi:hypothetical protein GXM_02215 [Nostoc sphaeroides CCNUC1]|uniref:Uncharacterized protein n=1 Tax=Nostoc sphaeroides CCNUC1 TaxID=2653204 RepID=A0A5P8VWH7_9NOSO|nr:hypothetical protein GXM_02215 [Nostoc sphaeroides CCNUC1]
MPKNPQNIVANIHASNTEITCWIRIKKEEKGQGAGGRKQNWDLTFRLRSVTTSPVACFPAGVREPLVEKGWGHFPLLPAPFPLPLHLQR